MRWRRMLFSPPRPDACPRDALAKCLHRPGTEGSTGLFWNRPALGKVVNDHPEPDVKIRRKALPVWRDAQLDLGNLMCAIVFPSQ